ncbi:hypothetical protein [Acinetobacter sp. MB5]|uniref:hypothetical protein n=1 Tax=Acinetobacter sp. MB5 TaxID=2069438 RepID=UPI0013A69286|nr:hypothetical protein [Acinetobacter sp. MB5]
MKEVFYTVFSVNESAKMMINDWNINAAFGMVSKKRDAIFFLNTLHLALCFSAT